MQPVLYFIIDDSNVSKMVITRALSSFGVLPENLLYAETVENAKRKWHEFGQENCIVILDLVLPGKGGGLHLLEFFKRAAPKPFVIIVSSKSDRETILKAKELGADCYLIKPFEPEKLQGVLEKAQHQLYAGELGRTATPEARF